MIAVAAAAAAMVLLAGTAPVHAAPGAADVLRTPWYEVRLDGAAIQSLCVDPAGKGNYGKAVLRNMQLGVGNHMQLQQSNASRRVFAGKVLVDAQNGRGGANNPYKLEPGHSLGVFFTSSLEEMTSAGLRMPTYNGKHAGALVRLYRARRTANGVQTDELVAEKRLKDLVDNEWADIPCSPQAPGTYFIEATEPEQEIGVWGDTSGKPSGDSFADGVPMKADLNYRCTGRNAVEGTLTLAASGADLKISFSPDQANAGFPGFSFLTDWKKDGYDLAPSPFDALYSTAGQFVYFNQLKRRPFSGAMLPAETVTLRGWDRFQLCLTMPGTGKFDWFAKDDGLLWRGGTMAMTLSVLPAFKKLPEWAPVFESSDARLGRLSTEFYLSHGANFGAGVNPDWKEWQGQIISWTANPQKRDLRGHLADSTQITPEGYVYTWGNLEGWPFPQKDDNEDGVNDYDTRHFTTNPCLVLGAWRYLSWNRDDSFARTMLPRARLAMDYMLGPLKGGEGLLVTNAKGHTGKDGGIGSNYWDILPFGHLDGFSNVYFCSSLEAMADIEEYARLHGISASGTVRTPAEYRRLASQARAAYRRTFWLNGVGRFAGCVDEDGVAHDYGFTFVNLEAAACGIPQAAQAKRIFHWLETGVTSSGKADIYSRWVIAPRSLTIHDPRRTEKDAQRPSWWFFGWPGTDYDGQCQDGGAILYVSFYDLMARLRYLGPDNALQRYREILARYEMPDRLSGGSPLSRGELTQGGPGGGAGAVGVEGEFPESGLVPCFVMHGLMGLHPGPARMVVEPRLPAEISFLRCRNVCYAGALYTVEVTRERVTFTRQKDGRRFVKPVTGGRAVFGPELERQKGKA